MPGPGPRPLTIFFSVGEPSGDVHAANLMGALRRRRANLRFVGYGGPKMRQAGCDLHTDLTALAVMWFLRVLANLGTFYRLVCDADRYFRHQRPDAVVLVDYPGFNWWIARRAKVHGIPVFYYTPPQIWAWASWRVTKMRRFVDHVLCSLPFEEDWFRERGCHATFVGHPFFDEVRQHHSDQDFVDAQRQRGPLVTILPGSRTQEVASNFRGFLTTAEIIRRARPDVQFAVACFKPQHARMCREMIAGSTLPLEVYVGRTPELMEAATCCLAVSGSVSLELLYHTKPTAVLYTISRFAMSVQRRFRRVKYITLVNLLSAGELYPDDLSPYDPAAPTADEALFPEYLTAVDKSSQLARHVLEWLNNDDARGMLESRLAELRDRVGHGGASRVAADYIVSTLDDRPSVVRRPHFLPGSAQRAANIVPG